MRRGFLLAAVAAAGSFCTAATMGSSSLHASEASGRRLTVDEQFTAAHQRLMRMFDTAKLQKRGQWEGVDVFYLPREGSSVFRTGQIVINAAPKTIADYFWDWDNYKLFDKKNTEDCKTLQVVSPIRKMVWFLGKPKPFVSPRDFVVLSQRTDNKDGSYAFLQISQSDKHPKTSAVRGDIWTILHISGLPEGAKNPKQSVVKYMMEIQPHGWIPVQAVDLAADDVPLSIGGLKKMLDGK